MKKSLGARTLAFPVPVWVIGTYSADSIPNIMTAAWTGICCSNPPCVNVSVRPERRSYENIVTHKAFTVNVPSAAFVSQVDYAGIVSGSETDKFKGCGLTSSASDVVDAPYINEFPLVLECAVINEMNLGAHTLFVGEIKDVKADAAVLDDEGSLVVEKINPFGYIPQLNSYYTTDTLIGKSFDIGKTYMK